MIPEQKSEGEALVRAPEPVEGSIPAQAVAHKSSRGESKRSTCNQLRSVTLTENIDLKWEGQCER